MMTPPRRYIWTKDGMVEFTDHPMQYGCGSTYYLAAALDAQVASLEQAIAMLPTPLQGPFREAMAIRQQGQP